MPDSPKAHHVKNDQMLILSKDSNILFALLINVICRRIRSILFNFD
jgi:hypothetical protein